jgi:hypothetical protein
MELQGDDPSLAGWTHGRPGASSTRDAPNSSPVFAAVDQRTQALANSI